jgi:hypothetical protein
MYVCKTISVLTCMYVHVGVHVSTLCTENAYMFAYIHRCVKHTTCSLQLLDKDIFPCMSKTCIYVYDSKVSTLTCLFVCIYRCQNQFYSTLCVYACQMHVCEVVSMDFLISRHSLLYYTFTVSLYQYKRSVPSQLTHCLQCICTG